MTPLDKIVESYKDYAYSPENDTLSTAEVPIYLDR